MRFPLKIVSLVIPACLGILVAVKFIRADTTHSPAPVLLTVKKQPLNSTLYGTGILRPSSTSAVASPVEGTITEVFFHYGDFIKAGQPLFRIASPRLLEDYRRTLTDCIKARSDALFSKNELQKSRLLHDNHLIAEDEYQNRIHAWHHARLVLLEAEAQLDSLMRQLDMKDHHLRDVKLQDIHSLEKALHLHEDTLEMTVTAPTSGVILLPSQREAHADPASGIKPGHSARRGELLAILGNTEVLQVSMPVNEFSIGELHPGLPATLSGAAFPDRTLKGAVTRVPMEASTGSDNLPLFRVEVTTAPLSDEERTRIRPGMSVEVAIPLEGTPLVTVPVRAVQHTPDGDEVERIDPASGQPHPVRVRTGDTSEDSVAILSGLQEGDQIVIADQTGKR